MALVRGKQIEALEDEAEAFAADAGELRLAQPRDIDALEEVVAARRPVEAAEDVHERRFARARRAHDGDELARAGRSGSTPRSAWTFDIADDEGAGDILDPDDRLGDFGAFARHRAPPQRRGGGRPDGLSAWPRLSAMMT